MYEPEYFCNPESIEVSRGPAPGHHRGIRIPYLGVRGTTDALYRFTLSDTLLMSQSSQARLRVMVATLLIRGHPSTQIIIAFIKSLYEQEGELEEYAHWDRRIKPHLTSLLT